MYQEVESRYEVIVDKYLNTIVIYYFRSYYHTCHPFEISKENHFQINKLLLYKIRVHFLNNQM